MGNRNGDDSEGPTRIGEQRRPTAVRGDASTEPAREVERDAGVQSAQRVTESGASTPAGSIAALARALASGVIDAAHVTRLFRSLCPITGQPDWASVRVAYRGPAIDPRRLLRYLLSYRGHGGFHEACVEQIFVDLRRRCAAERLTVQACFTRRGGIDINPWRSTEDVRVATPRPWRS